MVHTMECRHARHPWKWADDKTLVEVIGSVDIMWIRECKQCLPLAGFKANIDISP